MHVGRKARDIHIALKCVAFGHLVIPFARRDQKHVIRDINAARNLLGRLFREP